METGERRDTTASAAAARAPEDDIDVKAVDSFATHYQNVLIADSAIKSLKVGMRSLQLYQARYPTHTFHDFVNSAGLADGKSSLGDMCDVLEMVWNTTVCPILLDPERKLAPPLSSPAATRSSREKRHLSSQARPEYTRRPPPPRRSHDRNNYGRTPAEERDFRKAMKNVKWQTSSSRFTTG